MKTFGLVIVILALATVGLTACGGGDDDDETAATPEGGATTEAEGGGGKDGGAKAKDGGKDGGAKANGGGGKGGGGETVKVSANPNGQLAFEQKSLNARAGTVTFDFQNPAQLRHDFCIEGPGKGELGCTDTIKDSKSKLTVDLKPGKYTFYCSVDGHRAGGMEGALTVK